MTEHPHPQDKTGTPAVTPRATPGPNADARPIRSESGGGHASGQLAGRGGCRPGGRWGEPIVCCRDDAGRPVRRPLPAAYPSVRVTDTDEPCPACGAIDYEEYVPTE